jgi:hypothetical protein
MRDVSKFANKEGLKDYLTNRFVHFCHKVSHYNSTKIVFVSCIRAYRFVKDDTSPLLRTTELQLLFYKLYESKKRLCRLT